MIDDPEIDLRDLIERVVAESPSPLPWAEVERRATGEASSEPRRSSPAAVLLVAAAVLVVALVMSLWPSAESYRVTTIDRDTTTTVGTTPELATAEGGGWSGGLLDDVDQGSLRPLAELQPGDVVVATAPRGWRVQDSTIGNPDEVVGSDAFEWSIDLIEARPENNFGHVIYIRLSRAPICYHPRGCIPTSEATIDGLVWELVVPASPELGDDPNDAVLRAQVGDRWVSLWSGAPQWVDGDLLRDPQILEVIEGLRAGPSAVVTAVGEACWACGGPEGDPLDPLGSVDGGSGEPPDVNVEVDIPAGLGQLDEKGTIRLLAELEEGDVVLPTYIPEGLEYLPGASPRLDEDFGEYSFLLGGELAEGQVSAGVRQWNRAPIAGDPDDPNHRPVEVAGITWDWIDFERARGATVGPFDVWVQVHGLDPVEAARFVEGLRAVPLSDAP